jgi:hypothetical protein
MCHARKLVIKHDTVSNLESTLRQLAWRKEERDKKKAKKKEGAKEGKEFKKDKEDNSDSSLTYSRIFGYEYSFA